ncbi:unnamed protein product [marine sediment metagenome]|uniref:Uncharacterized protein n=1 Tax=marine sediment metagenome TaxID=412755 RepID=X1IMM9_9ZZZZ
MVSTTDYTDNPDRKTKMKILITGGAEVHPAPPSRRLNHHSMRCLILIKEE